MRTFAPLAWPCYALRKTCRQLHRDDPHLRDKTMDQLSPHPNKQWRGGIADRNDHQGHPFPSGNEETTNFPLSGHTIPLCMYEALTMRGFISVPVLAADHGSTEEFPGTGPSAPRPLPIGKSRTGRDSPPSHRSSPVFNASPPRNAAQTEWLGVVD